MDRTYVPGTRPRSEKFIVTLSPESPTALRIRCLERALTSRPRLPTHRPYPSRDYSRSSRDRCPVVRCDHHRIGTIEFGIFQHTFSSGAFISRGRHGHSISLMRCARGTTKGFERGAPSSLPWDTGRHLSRPGCASCVSPRRRSRVRLAARCFPRLSHYGRPLLPQASATVMPRQHRSAPG